MAWTEAEEKARIVERYARLTAGLRDVLPRLLTADRYRAVVAELTGSGWKHWHLLWATFGLLTNEHAQAAGVATDPPAMNHFMQAFLRDETLLAKLDAQRPVPVSAFSTTAMQFHLDTSFAAFLAGMGCSPPAGRGYKPGTFTKIASERFKMMDLDVDHNCPLDELAEAATSTPGPDVSTTDEEQA
ncbi:MAG: hypothetical protein ACYC63_11635 [Armatimonadota bacterium]